MALIFMEGFDVGPTAYYLTKGWGTVDGADMRTGRYGGQAFEQFTTTYRVLPSSYTTLIVGLAFKFFNGDAKTIVMLRNGSTNHVELRVSGSPGALSITRDGTTILGPSSAFLSLSTWYYYEFKATIHDTAGVAQVKVNGTSILSGTGLDTRNGATSTIDTLRMSEGELDVLIDDLYVLDDSGSINNDFIGERRVVTLFPTGVGNSSDWLPSSYALGSNYQNVDEVTVDGDTTYNASLTAGNIDLFTCPDLAAGTASISGIQANLYARKADAGSHTLRSKVRIDGTNYNGSSSSLGSSYALYMQLNETNPATSAVWTPGEVNGAEFGYELVS